MKKISLGFLILFFTACGIDKESPPPPLSSIGSIGQLDTSFYDKGFVTFSSLADGNGQDEFLAMTFDSQQRLVVVGQSDNSDINSDLVVMRFLPEGELDMSFATDGLFTHHNAAGGGGADMGYAVVTGADNEIYVTGYSRGLSSDRDMAVWKLTPSGTLDTDFGTGGIFTHDNAAGGNFHDEGRAIALDSSGRIVVAGFSHYTSSRRALTLWRLLPDGTLDTDFDGDGIVWRNDTPSTGSSQAESFRFNLTGDIFVAGRLDDASGIANMAVWKLQANGALDTGFASGGVFQHDNAAGGEDFDAAMDLAIDDEGRLLIAGNSTNAIGNSVLTLWRLTNQGALDTSFINNGVQTFDVSNIYGISSQNYVEALTLDPQGRPVVTGSCKDDMCAWRFLPDGAIDEDFGNNGFMAHNSAAGGFALDSGSCVLLDAEGRILIGGRSQNSLNRLDAVLWRLR